MIFEKVAVEPSWVAAVRNAPLGEYSLTIALPARGIPLGSRTLTSTSTGCSHAVGKEGPLDRWPAPGVGAPPVGRCASAGIARMRSVLASRRLTKNRTIEMRGGNIGVTCLSRPSHPTQ